MKWLIWFLFLIQFVATDYAMGWGSYAHQQVNTAAVTLLNNAQSKSSIAQCLVQSSAFIQRLAITPDYDWKVVGTAPTDEAAKSKRGQNDRYEHPLHFFEADAFIEMNPFGANPETLQNKIANLPSDADYKNVALAKYTALLANPINMADVKLVDGSKAPADPNSLTVEDVTIHGTAPWRARQMFQLAVTGMLNNKMNPTKFPITTAISFLGAMGHYVGDMSQPFHAAMDFNGQYDPHANPSMAMGIHAGFETEMFALGNEKIDLEDKDDFLYPNFNLTVDGVLASGQKYLANQWPAITQADFVSYILTLISSGYQYAEPMMAAFSKEVVEHPPKEETPKQAAPKKHPLPSKVDIEAHNKKSAKRFQASTGLTVMDVAQMRIGQAAALLARLWYAAWIAAGSPKLDCTGASFDRDTVINLYQIPDYLPANHLVAPKNTTTEPEKSGASAAAVRAFTLDPL